MKSLPETFKNCITMQSNKKCPACKANLYCKRVKIDENKFKSVKILGITHKAVNFCSNPECTFLEQGIVYVKDSHEKFFGLKEIDHLIKKTLNTTTKK